MKIHPALSQVALPPEPRVSPRPPPALGAFEARLDRKRDDREVRPAAGPRATPAHEASLIARAQELARQVPSPSRPPPLGATPSDSITVPILTSAPDARPSPPKPVTFRVGDLFRGVVKR